MGETVCCTSWKFQLHTKIEGAQKRSHPRDVQVMAASGSSRLSPDILDGGVASVAVIGAGISGVTAAAHLLKEGLQVKLFERAAIAGGIWHFDPRAPESPAYPSNMPSVGDYHTTRSGQFSLQEPRTPPEDAGDGLKWETRHPLLSRDVEKLEISFAPPSPCYAGLKNNVPTNLMVSSLGPWPEGTASNVSQDRIEEYVQTLSANHGVNDVAEYSTRVEEVNKSPDGRAWVIRTLKLRHEEGEPRLEEETRQFDAVVVATGHYNLPLIPDIPGLKEWKDRFGNKVIHSKEYRRPEPFRNETVFVLGCGVSSMDITRELGNVANKVYQSSRGGMYDLPATLLPENGRRVGPVARFEISEGNPGTKTIVLQNGERIEDVDRLILATGYIKSYPFLANFHDDTIAAEEVGPNVLVSSDGQMMHNLHKDIFYIEDPTLTFVGVPYHTATFSLFDHQSQAVARVLSGKAQLPSRKNMRREYTQRIKDKGIGREFHSLGGDSAELNYVKDLVDWVNVDADRLGFERIEGHSEAWVAGYWVMKERIKAIREGATSKWLDGS